MSYSVLLLDQMQDYLEDLCTKHMDIQHLVDGKRAFARFETDAQIDEIVQSGGDAIVVVANFAGQRIGGADDDMIRQTITLLFAVKKFGDDEQSGITNAIRKAENIMMDFMTRMEFDKEENCNLLRYLVTEGCSWDKIEGPWLDNFWGWEFTMPLKSYTPAYNPAKWSA